MVKRYFLMFFDHCDVMLSFLYVSIVYVEFEKMVITILLVGFCARANEDKAQGTAKRRITNIFISEINKQHSRTKCKIYCENFHSRLFKQFLNWIQQFFGLYVG